jgi:hypothetical protein
MKKIMQKADHVFSYHLLTPLWIFHFLDVDSNMIHSFDNDQGSGSGNGWIELVLIEGRDLVAADLRGTSDPYVRVHYGNFKKRTKVGILHSWFIFY